MIQGTRQEPPTGPPRALLGPPGTLKGASGTSRGTVQASVGPFGAPRGAPDPQNEVKMVLQASPGHPKWHHFGDRYRKNPRKQVNIRSTLAFLPVFHCAGLLSTSSRVAADACRSLSKMFLRSSEYLSAPGCRPSVQ